MFYFNKKSLNNNNLYLWNYIEYVIIGHNNSNCHAWQPQIGFLIFFLDMDFFSFVGQSFSYPLGILQNSPHACINYHEYHHAKDKGEVKIVSAM